MVLIQGIWIRNHRGKLQVLVELNTGDWRQIHLEHFDLETLTCHIVNPSGILAAPVVDAAVDFEPSPA